MKLAFIITNFNNSRYTLQFVNSVNCLDNHDDFIIIIVDNNSNIDNSLILKDIESQNRNVKVVYLNENIGYFKGLNIGTSVEIVRELFKNKLFKNDLYAYVESGMSGKKKPQGLGLPQNEVKVGEFLPSLEDFKKLIALDSKPKPTSSGSGKANQMFQQPRPGSKNTNTPTNSSREDEIDSGRSSGMF